MKCAKQRFERFPESLAELTGGDFLYESREVAYLPNVQTPTQRFKENEKSDKNVPNKGLR